MSEHAALRRLLKRMWELRGMSYLSSTAIANGAIEAVEQEIKALAAVPASGVAEPPSDEEFVTIDGEQQTRSMVVKNLAMLVRRLVHRLPKDDVVAKKALDYLLGEGLQGSPLRAASGAKEREALENLARVCEEVRRHSYLSVQIVLALDALCAAREPKECEK